VTGQEKSPVRKCLGGAISGKTLFVSFCARRTSVGKKKERGRPAIKKCSIEVLETEVPKKENRKSLRGAEREVKQLVFTIGKRNDKKRVE